MLRAFTFAFIVFALAGWLGVASFGCEMCRHFDSHAYHVEALGGDDSDDAFTPPSDAISHDEEEAGYGAFALSSYKWPQPGGPGNLVTITYSFNNLLNGGLLQPNGTPLPVELIRESVEEALGLWSSVAPLRFVEVPDEGREPVELSSYPEGGQYGDIRFSHLYYNGPDPPTGNPIAKALAYYPTGGTLAGDVFFDNGDRWQEVGTLPNPDILGAAIHEIGHALGLGHSNFTSSNMYWIFRRYSGLGTGLLTNDDILGIRSIYGTGSGYVRPLNYIPEPGALLLAAMAAMLLVPYVRRLRGR